MTRMFIVVYLFRVVRLCKTNRGCPSLYCYVSYCIVLLWILEVDQFSLINHRRWLNRNKPIRYRYLSVPTMT